MRIWFDTEFIEDGKTIELISIGMVCEDGRDFYLENSDCDLTRADDWVQENVVTHLTGQTETRANIAKGVREFCGPNPQFWAYYADYDWVVLCQLFGRMIDLPDGWPMYCQDIKQLADFMNVDLSVIPNARAHNAFADADWCRKAHLHIQRSV